MSAIIVGLIIGGVCGIVYMFTRNMGRQVSWIAMLIVAGLMTFVLKGCIFG